MDTTTELLAQRGTQHGDYTQQAAFSQRLKDLMRYSPNWQSLTPYQKESLEMNAVKVSRILSGNPNNPDHWADIAGYARLSADRTENDQADLFKPKQESTNG